MPEGACEGQISQIEKASQHLKISGELAGNFLPSVFSIQLTVIIAV